MLGADAAAGAGARLVGILPATTVRWRRLSARRLFLDTGLPHNVRHVITGRTPDVVVAFGGSQGTLAEVAFAKAAGCEVIFYAGLKRLRQNFEKYFGQGSAHTHRETYFEEPLRTYPEASGPVGTVSGLISLLAQTLAESKEADCAITTLADYVEATARQKGPVAFDFQDFGAGPGGFRASCALSAFASWVRQMLLDRVLAEGPPNPVACSKPYEIPEAAEVRSRVGIRPAWRDGQLDVGVLGNI